MPWLQLEEDDMEALNLPSTPKDKAKVVPDGGTLMVVSLSGVCGMCM